MTPPSTNPLSTAFMPTSQDEAVEAVLARLEAMHTAILTGTPFAERCGPITRCPDVPAWEAMVRLMPCLCDYEMFARRANKAQDDHDTRLEQREERVEAREREADAKMGEAWALLAKLRPLETALDEALTTIRANPPTQVQEEPPGT